MSQDRQLLHRAAARNDAGQPLVVIVDDDASVREGLTDLVQSAGYSAVAFGSTSDLLGSDTLDAPGCLILDVRMPGASGLELQRQLQRNGNPKPVISASRALTRAPRRLTASRNTRNAAAFASSVPRRRSLSNASSLPRTEREAASV